MVRISPELAASSPPGARSQSASVLTSLQELKEVRDNLSEKEAQLQDTERQLAGLKGTAEKYADISLNLLYFSSTYISSPRLLHRPGTVS